MMEETPSARGTDTKASIYVDGVKVDSRCLFKSEALQTWCFRGVRLDSSFLRPFIFSPLQYTGLCPTQFVVDVEILIAGVDDDSIPVVQADESHGGSGAIRIEIIHVIARVSESSESNSRYPLPIMNDGPMHEETKHLGSHKVR